jgi:hypothetical protein
VILVVSTAGKTSPHDHRVTRANKMTEFPADALVGKDYGSAILLQ